MSHAHYAGRSFRTATNESVSPLHRHSFSVTPHVSNLWFHYLKDHPLIRHLVHGLMVLGWLLASLWLLSGSSVPHRDARVPSPQVHPDTYEEGVRLRVRLR